MKDFDYRKYLAEGKLLREEMELEFFNNDEDVALIANSGEYEAEIKDGKVSFSVAYEDEDDRDGMEFSENNWKSILGPNHAFVEVASKIPTEVEAIDDYVMITVNLEDLKGIASLAEGKLLSDYMNKNKTNKMKKSELKEMIKTALLEENNYYEDNIDEAEEVDVEDNEDIDVDIEKDVEVDDESVETDIDVKGSMPGEGEDEIAVQSLLMKAQEEAEKLGDEKLTDQIGNTITYFTRAHVATVDEAEEIDEIAALPGSTGVEDVNVDNPAEDAMVGLTETLRWQRIAGIAKDNGLYSK